jgi:hypothetical protein
MTRYCTYFVRVVAVFAMFPSVAEAYIGPGLGLGAIGSVLGMFLCFFLAGFAVIWHPIKKLIRRIRKTDSERTAMQDTGMSADRESSQNSRH